MTLPLPPRLVLATLTYTLSPRYTRPGIHLHKTLITAPKFKGDMDIVNQFIGPGSTLGLQFYMNPFSGEFDVETEFEGRIGFTSESMGEMVLTHMKLGAHRTKKCVVT